MPIFPYNTAKILETRLFVLFTSKESNLMRNYFPSIQYNLTYKTFYG